MAAEQLIITIRADGTREVQRKLRRVGDTARRQSSNVGLMRNALLAIGGTAVIAGLGRTIDSFTNLQNRLRVVTSSTDELGAVTDELLRVSNETRSSLQTNAELYNRLALSTTQLGLSQRNLITLTQSLNQAVILSGASATEASAGLIQLSQGLASGALRGDELRSVLEQLPIVADVIAKQMGVTRGELREMGKEGKITAEVIVEAFAAAREELAEKFAKTVPTMGQAFQVLRNNLTIFIGKMATTSGIAKTLTNAIFFLAENVEAFAKTALIGGVVVALTLVIAAFSKLRVVLLANPLFFLAATLVVLIGVLIEFKDQIILGADGVTTLGDYAGAVFELLIVGFGLVREAAANAMHFWIDLWNKTFKDDLPKSFEGFLLVIAKGIDKLIGFHAGIGAAIIVAFKNPFETIKFLAVELVNFVIRHINLLIKAIFQELRRMVGLIKPFLHLLPVTAQKALNDLSGVLDKGFQIEPIKNKFRQHGEDIGDAFKEGIKKSTQAEDLVRGLAGRAGELGKQRRAGPTEEEIDRLQRLNNQLDKLNDKTKNNNKDIKEGVTVLSGFADGLVRAEMSARQFGLALSDIVVGAVQQFSDVMADAIVEGIQNWDDFRNALSDIFKQIAKQIISLIIQFLILQAVSGLGGALGGAVAPAGAQAGGPIGVGETRLVGERGPELFTPTRSGNITPNSQTSMQQPIMINMINVKDEEEVAHFLNTSEGDAAIVNVIGRNAQQVSQIVQGTA